MCPAGPAPCGPHGPHRAARTACDHCSLPRVIIARCRSLLDEEDANGMCVTTRFLRWRRSQLDVATNRVTAGARSTSAFRLRPTWHRAERAQSARDVVAGPHVGLLGVFADQRQQLRTFAPAHGLHGQVHFAALNLQRRILGQRRLHLSTQATLTCFEPLHLHDMKTVYRVRSERSNFLHSVFSDVVRFEGRVGKVAAES
jgi:hypothetical protein